MNGKAAPTKAKARLCAQGQNDPDCAAGLVKTDAPTVQRVSTMLFLQMVVNLGWVPNLMNGDISNAFLQGKPDLDSDLYMHQPQRGIPGMQPGQILRLMKPVYGRPDAPRAWFNELSSVFINELHYEQSSLDQALF